MYLKFILGVFFSIVFCNQSVCARENINDIPEEKIQIFKCDEPTCFSIDVEYLGYKGTAIFINKKNINEDSSNLTIYFHTNNHQELDKVLEISSDEYDKLISAFIFKENNGNQSIFILTKSEEDWGNRYRYRELPLVIDGGVLKARFFPGDDAFTSYQVCIDDFSNPTTICEYSTQEGLEQYLNKERNK